MRIPKRLYFRARFVRAFQRSAVSGVSCMLCELLAENSRVQSWRFDVDSAGDSEPDSGETFEWGEAWESESSVNRRSDSWVASTLWIALQSSTLQVDYTKLIYFKSHILLRNLKLDSGTCLSGIRCNPLLLRTRAQCGVDQMIGAFAFHEESVCERVWRVRSDHRAFRLTFFVVGSGAAHCGEQRRHIIFRPVSTVRKVKLNLRI